MKTLTRIIALGSIFALGLIACNGIVTPPPTPATVDLKVSATNATSVSAAGQTINYSYIVTLSGGTSLQGPVTISDDKSTPTCPNMNAVGNYDNVFDRGETVTCTSTYAVSAADIAAGTVTSNAIAKIDGKESNRVTTSIALSAAVKALSVTVAASPFSFNAAGDTITYTYTIQNTGSAVMGPTQFVVTDTRVGTTNCDVPTRTLGPGDSISCTGKTTVTQADLGGTTITNTVTASGDGVASQPATSTISRGGIVPPSPTNPLTPGSTIIHSVTSGEWLYQIARCYGADINAVVAANRQIRNPHWILPSMSVTVPNIGSEGSIYGPPCVGYHVVQANETWELIAGKYNADVRVLQVANRYSLFTGACLKIPLNSVGQGRATQVPATSCPPGSYPNPNPPPITPIPNQTVIRISFPSGQYGTTVNGTVPGNSSIRYLVAASQGQTMTVRLTPTANTVTMGITASNGTILKSQDSGLTFTGLLPSTGDVSITVVSPNASAASFTLEVTVTNPNTQVPFERVADINPGINNSDPAFLASFNNFIYFRATGNNNAGAELWKLDPVSKQPSLVADIFPGASGSNPSYITFYNGHLYFSANGNDGAGNELWRYNGSDKGRVADINNGAGDSNPAYFAMLNNVLFFSAKGSDSNGTELWRTDGADTRLAADINTGSADSNPSYLTKFNGALYFAAIGPDGSGNELWRFDGTNIPTRVADINAGAGNSNPSHFAEFNGALYFSANGNDGTGVELWKYDGVNAPMRAADINVGGGDSSPSYLTVFNSALYFSANGNDGTGVELWRYDATGVRRVSDINSVGNTNPSYLLVVGTELYFQANSNDGTGTELWKFRGP